MKKLLLVPCFLLLAIVMEAQLLRWQPAFPVQNDAASSVVITMDANFGNQGLLNYTPTSDVYVHTGVITNLSSGPTNWKYVKFNQDFNQPNSALQAVYIGANRWQFTIAGSLRAYYGVTDPSENILRIAILFRSGNGTKVQRNRDGSDMYVPVYTSALATRISQPFSQPKYNLIPEPQSWSPGSNFTLQGIANKVSAMKLYHNGNLLASLASDDTISAPATVGGYGLQQLVIEANDGTGAKYDTMNIFVPPPSPPVADLPAGMKDGLNYHASNTSVTLVLHAPNKSLVTLIGDFNNWLEDIPYVMNRTPDGNRYWIQVNGLVPGTEYAFQYKVDDTIRIADPYTEKILDPWNDSYISSTTYPGLKPYPAEKTTGIVSLLQTSAPTYSWAINDFPRPDMRKLVIYELLVRDFVEAHDWKTLSDTLRYLKNLGVNAIELMPFNEFEGNVSWGYNSDFYFAPDKYYGPKNSLKQFIDSCHTNGIAVIMDIVLNHTYGPSPLAQLYWDSQNNRPAANNPWYNPVKPHAFGFGEDFNHESASTRNFFNRVLQHWVTEYNIDGYRVDFSKGLTQRPSSNDAEFSAYDASRISIINNYANAIRAVEPSAYIILEHFCVDAEEIELSNNGMLIWGNLNHNFSEAAMGWLNNSNFERGIFTVRGMTQPHLVTYMESHDEERLMYKNIQFGNSNANYSTKDTATALKRMEMNAAFLLNIPGPKMIWQFGELGYDYPINYCPDGTISNDCRTSPKPIRWDYKLQTRRKRLYDIYSSLLKLRAHPLYTNTYTTNNVERSLGGGFKWLKVTTDTSNILVVGNFDIIPQTGSVSFQSAGTWYDYLNGSTITATGSPQNLTLQPGEYHVYLNRNVTNLVTTPVPDINNPGNQLIARIFPNPASDHAVLEVAVPGTGNLQFEIINIAGQSVGSSYNRILTRGTHRLPLDAYALPPGMYSVVIRHGNKMQTIKFILQ